jgi:hypothetical protein
MHEGEPMSKTEKSKASKARRERRNRKRELAVRIVANLIAKQPTARQLAEFKKLFPEVAKKLEDPKD